ncbi:MAG: transglutaminase domain-containing protein [Clostridia bacterium]|nr:transglutaminase domain-containing protein [Clostridia bacterium]
MSRLPEKNWKELLMGYCTALLLALGMSLSLFRAFAPRQALWPILPLCAGMTLALHALFQLRFKHKKWIFLALTAALSLWGALGGGPVHDVIQMGKAAYLSFLGIPDALAPFAGTARWALCLLLSLLGAALYWDHTVPLAIFTVLSMVGISFAFGEQETLLLCALPSAAGVLLMMARENAKRLSALPIAAALTVLAFLLLPAKPQAVSPFQEIAQNIRQFVEDYLLFNEFRSAFTLTSEGFQPLDDRLGGPAEPKEHDVMEVNTDRKVLLRGKTYDQYTGLNWYDTLSSRRYLSVSPRYTALREELFDLNRPLAGDDSALLSMRVRMLDQGTTTLFAPGRTRSLQLEGERMVLYYNTAGEYFLTRGLEPGDTYSLTYLPYEAGAPGVAQLVSDNAGMNDPYYEEIASRYLQIPQHIQKEVYDIAARATEGRETPYQKALGIMNYLRRNYRYSLDVQEPPEAVDFIAWFLIGEREGYCTYFASAMTMLCRIAGIPARYVTGYVALPNDSGVTVVSGKHAHAWTEIYLNGFGWLPIDATPRSDYGDDPLPEDDPPPSGGNNAPAPTATPEPTALPTVPPVEAPTPEPSPEPTETPENNSDQPTPTPAPPPPDEPPPEAPPQENGPKHPFPWWMILLLLALIALIVLRVYLTEPVRQAERHPDRAVSILFFAVAALLSVRGLRRMPNETLHDFAGRVDSAPKKGSLPDILPLVDAYASQVYGRHRINGNEYQEIYIAVRNAASPLARLRVTVRRIFKGNR